MFDKIISESKPELNPETTPERRISDDGNFELEIHRSPYRQKEIFIIWPKLRYITGIASEYSLIDAMKKSRKELLEDARNLLERADQLDSMIREAERTEKENTPTTAPHGANAEMSNATPKEEKA